MNASLLSTNSSLPRLARRPNTSSHSKAQPIDIFLATLRLVSCKVASPGKNWVARRPIAELPMPTIPDNQDTAQNCYTMAYFVLPAYVFDDVERLVDTLSRDPTRPGSFYMMACSRNQREPRMELFRSFPVHQGNFDAATRYCIIEYPTPPEVDLSDLSLEEMFAKASGVVLAPYFSAVVWGKEGVRYFILGQSPNGGTTLRQVTLESNANCGPGCEPELGAFIALLREHIASH